MESDKERPAPLGAEAFAHELDEAELSPAIPEHPLDPSDDAVPAPVKPEGGGRMTH